MLRSKAATTLLVVITNPLLSTQMKSATMSDLMSLSNLLMLAICLFDIAINLSELFELIETMICLLKGP